MINSPFALEGKRKNGKYHHLHTVRHPAQPNDEAQHDLELSESDVVDSLGHSKGIVRDNSTRRCCHLDLRPDHVEVGRGAPPEGVVPLPLTGHGEEVGV